MMVADDRIFDTGATRDSVKGKPSYLGYLSVDVIRSYGAYMLKNQHLGEPNERSADNWKKGMPIDVYMDSMFRHFMDVWDLHEAKASPANKTEPLCALLFNVMGYLHEVLNNGVS